MLQLLVLISQGWHVHNIDNIDQYSASGFDCGQFSGGVPLSCLQKGGKAMSLPPFCTGQQSWKLVEKSAPS